jgi:hypothetical protein
VQGRYQGAGGVVDFDDDGIIGREVQHVAECGASAVQETESRAWRQQAGRFVGILGDERRNPENNPKRQQL